MSVPTSPTPNQPGFPPFPRSQRRTRQGSTASSASYGSIGGGLDPASHSRRNSTVREHSHNAISTLLQPSIVRTGLVPRAQAPAGFKAPTTKDIPPVTLTNIPHVPTEEFQDYLTRIGPLFESIQRKRAPEHGPSAPADQQTANDRSATPTSPTVESPVNQKLQRTSSSRSRRRTDVTPLSIIPPVYFDEIFHLENPRTFDVVSENAEIVRPPTGTAPTESNSTTPRKALATNAILQEKLSWYMDTVEVHLIKSISAASSSFFAALGSLKELQIEAEASVAKIQSLRGDLRRLDREVAIGGLEVAAKRRRRANVAKLARASGQVERVVHNVRRADELVDEGDFDEAANHIDRVTRLVCGQPEPGESSTNLIDLRALKVLQGLDSGLQDIQSRIAAGLAQRFTSILMSDLREHVQRVPHAETLKRWLKQRGISLTYMESTDTFRNNLRSALSGLTRAGHITVATASYRDSVIREMKALLKKNLPSSTDDDAESTLSISTRGGGGRMTPQEKSGYLARNLRAMDAADAENMLVNVYTAVGEALRRVSTQVKLLLDVASSMEATALPKSPGLTPRSPGLIAQATSGGPRPRAQSNVQQELLQTLDMSSLLGQAVDTAQTQITKVLRVRNEQTLQLPRERFMRYFSLNRAFADECEAISGRSGDVLKGLINAQITAFIQAQAEGESQRLAALLVNDDWNAKDLDSRGEDLLNRIVNSMTSDPLEWSNDKPIWENVGESTQLTVQVNGENGASNGTGAKSASKPAYIDGNKYILVGPTIALLSTIDTLLSLTSSMPSMTPAISTALLDSLRVFNSRCQQLILGAGATKTSGLKNITTKHLALSSQSLSFVIALIPYMRECVRRHLPGGGQGQPNILADFDKTKRLYQEHQSGINEKLIEIIISRAQTHIKTMKSLPWDSPEDDGKVSAYMEGMIKETTTFYRVLSRHLSEYDIKYIMRRIFETFEQHWTAAFASITPESEAAKARFVRDAEAFNSRLGKVAEMGDAGQRVVDAAKERVKGEEKS
ncbi:Vps54-domain-containing protein [Piedraia hortae CBS 480.64]|uniref:Vacuolar protein sorting-associated protein 54 n=1 Tax=Piedraia hortae CBS 480.64 TaxID=1314780 RepID=A0A6A7BXR0_9PEZI|nr:Vps54-domain-containing protein [Piedraia hortae CBS 480.64]